MTEALPKTCECGGQLVYQTAHGRQWVHCKECTPVVELDPDWFHKLVAKAYKLPLRYLKGEQ
jgi:hypothetical protein